MSEAIPAGGVALRFRRGRGRPAAEMPAETPPGPAGAETPPRPLVLVLDPDEATRGFIAARLRRICRVATAGDGRQGLAVAGREHPDLILSAVDMPAMDGIEVLKTIRNDTGPLGRISVVLMASGAELPRLAEAGCLSDDALIKPFCASELIARVGAAIRTRVLERRLAEASARMSLIMDNVPAGIVVLRPIPGDSPDFMISAVNKNVNKVAGFDQQMLYAGGRLAVCLRPAAMQGMYGECDIDHRIAERMRWYASRPGETISSVFPTLGGRFVKATRSPHLDFGFLVVTIDITDQIKAEQELQAACERAESVLANLLSAQNQLVQVEKLASLGRLVAGVAHEINTPLGIAVTVSSLFAERVKELAATIRNGRLRRSEMEDYIAETREGCELMQSNLRRAADLVQSFRQVAADQASDGLRRFELGGWLSEIVVSLSPVWRKPGHRVEIVCPEPIELENYPGVISQILTNLVTNSVIHGFEPGQRGLVTIAAVKSGADGVELRYTDDGRGIPPEVGDKVFDPFYTTRRGAGSTGLGMYIIRNLAVGKLGGGVELGSHAGGGACFVIRFPLVPTPRGLAGEGASDPAPAPGLV